MSFDLAALAKAVAAQGCVVRLVVAAVEGSAPREVGAAMLVWRGGHSGTIGGGALEFAAMAAAARLLEGGATRWQERVALGPGLGQCCGGSVRLLYEVWDAASLPGLSGDVVARAVGDGPMPLAVQRMLTAARGAGVLPKPGLTGGWMVEPVSRAKHVLWVWGAGHVGRALVSVLAPLPDVRLRWIDVDRARFPAVVPDGVTIATKPAELVAQAGPGDHHLIVTYSHALDLDLCHRLLQRGFATCGLIGSATKWARFRGRLAALGHAPDAISCITCPIGDPSLGKHPQAIAIGVAWALMARWQGGEAVGGTDRKRRA